MLSTFDCTDLLQWDQHMETPSCYYLVITIKTEPHQTVHNKFEHCFQADADLSVSLDDPVTNTLAAGWVSPQLFLKVHGRASAGPLRGIQRPAASPVLFWLFGSSCRRVCTANIYHFHNILPVSGCSHSDTVRFYRTCVKQIQNRVNYCLKNARKVLKTQACTRPLACIQNNKVVYFFNVFSTVVYYKNKGQVFNFIHDWHVFTYRWEFFIYRPLTSLNILPEPERAQWNSIYVQNTRNHPPDK